MFETSLRTMLQRKSRSVLAAFLILAVLVLSSGVLAVRKKIDFDKLDKEWKDEEEDEDWHEDSYEWKRKMQEKKQPAFDMSNIQNMKPEELMAMQGGGEGGGGGGGMSMTFAQLKDGICTSRKCTNELAVKWADLMGTGGIQAKPYAVEDDQILFTQEDGNTMQLKDFILEQPEVLKWTYNSRDYYPDGVTPPVPKDDGAKKKKKKRKRKRRKKKGKNKKRAAEKKTEL